MSLQLEFVGHACFRLWQDGVPTIVMDPFTHSDLKLPDDGLRLEADTVIVSSLTDDSHNNYKLVNGNPKVINALDVATGNASATINGEPLVAIPAAEVPDHPTGPDDNGIYAFYAGGLWFAHLGDLGFGLSDEELAPWRGKCDVLLAIVGESLTLKLDELDPMIEFLRPKVIFPMHYNLPPVGSTMSPVTKFLERRTHDPIIHVPHHTIHLPLPEIVSGRPTIVVLQPSGYTPTTN